MRIGLVLIGLLAIARVAAAADDPDTEIARRRFLTGAKAYVAGNYERALEEFEAAREVKPLAAFDFNIARCHDRLQHEADAIAAYERFLDRADVKSDAAEISESRQRVQALRERLAAREQRSSPSHEPREAAAAPSPPQPAREAAPSPTQAAPEAAPSRRWLLAPLTVGAGAIALLGAGLGLYLSAKSDYDAFVPGCTPRCDPAQLTPIEARTNASYALTVAGGVVAAADVALWAVLARRGRAPHVAVSIVPSLSGASVSLGGAF